MRVLVADDDPVFTRLTDAGLAARGCEVTVVHDAVQALTVAMRARPDAIVLDLTMPGGTGFTTLGRLKLSYHTRMIPVVVVTGGTGPDDETRARALGATEFLRKPVPAQSLYAALRRALHPPAAAIAS
jgi:CheY-like chemotaxis protein